MVLSPIERLPLELLQPIFVAAELNIALPKASPYIATRLSSEYIYHSTCDFFLTEVRGKRIEQSAAQTQIFATKWLTWSFFKSWILRRFGPRGCLCDCTTDEGCFDAQWPPDFEDATRMVFSRSHLPRLAFVKGRIPRKLLRAPWNQEKTEFLRFLLWITSMSVDWNDPETLRVATDGRKQAMLDGNLAAVELFNHNRRLGQAADLETVRFAVMEAGCDRSVVYDTLLAANMWSLPGIDRYSIELYEWCDSRALKGDPKGTWLRKKLEESAVLCDRNTADEKDYRTSVLIKSVSLNPETEAYDGGPDDQLCINDLEWNKVRKHFNARSQKVPTKNTTVDQVEQLMGSKTKDTLKNRSL
ncbi:hypothetical protein PtrSN002B_010991 [Pyrenophora tritici-repentis]|uniref:Uncharacterized protein n=1 Tax=Pyrenophora tritici-repentis TaxID=45151 RepID=A0A2W1FRC9_9PLEO|nr:hypothetical protein PtrV1_05990 [Pyrenophora tritici-repentis]KAF7573372.1 hypothetical protein PtrM4_082770 [Pyrenophora tritici-repentis]KAI0570246.1 hypothetical protein Alg215_11174 [Pyrenophora tritici-repentis]KAI1516309.1 hypothetical protein Ptr86124_004846 [Pyrenophora tritici-repentis]KAI1524137.1 hypothetical protein PtrSN001C_011168 [Pyrenophora tritici-repentis]